MLRKIPSPDADNPQLGPDLELSRSPDDGIVTSLQLISIDEEVFSP